MREQSQWVVTVVQHHQNCRSRTCVFTHGTESKRFSVAFLIVSHTAIPFTTIPISPKDAWRTHLPRPSILWKDQQGCQSVCAPCVCTPCSSGCTAVAMGTSPKGPIVLRGAAFPRSP